MPRSVLGVRLTWHPLYPERELDFEVCSTTVRSFIEYQLILPAHRDLSSVGTTEAEDNFNESWNRYFRFRPLLRCRVPESYRFLGQLNLFQGSSAIHDTSRNPHHASGSVRRPGATANQRLRCCAGGGVKSSVEPLSRLDRGMQTNSPTRRSGSRRKRCT